MKQFNVTSGKIDRRIQKLGYCYHNAFQKSMKEDYEYVEGTATNKITGIVYDHAWNVDSNGNHIDFTYKNANEFEYNGVVLPIEKVIEINRTNGYTFQVLPFIK
jgi:hypothetical protein